jgi:hypothetical protein
MTLTATLNEMLSQWSARREAGEGGVSALASAARRFATQVASPAPLEAAPNAERVPLTRATLSVVSGVHRGACLDLTEREYLIGSDAECDIVLQDPAIAARHVTVAREWSGFTVRDLRAEKTPPIVPQSIRHEGDAIECIYDIGGALLRLTQHPPERAATMPEREAAHRAPAAALWSALTVLLVAIAIAWVAVNRAAEPTPSIAQRIVTGSQALLAQGFDMARFRQGTHGGLEIAGIVPNLAEKQRLREWLAHSAYADAVLTVQSVADLVSQVRDTLGSADLQIALHGNRLRVAGTTRQLAVKNRLRALTDELAGLVTLEDRVAYVDTPEPAEPGPLPVKLRGVMIGNPSYFLTDSGARYFVGGVLPDGAEVLAIEPTQIRFRSADRVFVYTLD